MAQIENLFLLLRTKGEFFPYFLSSEIWWKWEQNNTRVVAKEGPEPSNKETFQGISSKKILDGFNAIKTAE